MGTSRDHRNLMKTGIGVLLLLALLQTETEAQNCPSGTLVVDFNEGNEVGAVVTTIAAPEGATLVIEQSDGPFRLDGYKLVATESVDYELINETPSYRVKIGCTTGAEELTIIVSVKNVNDNIPTFDQEVYDMSFPEMTPIDTVLWTFHADDPDDLERLFYTLTPATGPFRLESEYNPVIIVNELLQYDDVKTVQLTLTVQDTVPATPNHTDSTIINITITDVDNRPPWFQPCDPVVIQGVKICPNTGYNGTVDLGVLETGPLPLRPHGIRAIDGDNGINERIKYKIISGGTGLFEIGEDTGDLTLVKAVDVLGFVHMTVMAYQEKNSFQFATTTLVMEVDVKSLHKPQFEKSKYEAVVEGLGSMAVDAADKTQILKIVATDEDYAAHDQGINPNLVYSITGSDSDAFSLYNGFLFMIREAPAGSYELKVKAEDLSHFEEVTADLVVEVVEEPTTTAPPTTVSTPTPEPTTGETTVPTPGSTVITTNQSPSPTTKPDPTSPSAGPSTLETSNPSTNPPTPSTTGGSVQTPNPTPTTEGITAHTGGVINPPGGFTSVDMAALGATLGVLVFICVVVIAVLAVKLRKGNSDWRKINEASAFRSSLGPSGQKEGVQFTNEAFQHDDDDKDDKDNKGGPSGGGLANGTVPSRLEKDKPQSRSIPRPPSPIQDDEKEVKPILSKDKSKEDGYKAVWFKEDIDPNAKEEVVIIPDSRAEEDEEDSDGYMKMPKVKFSDTDRDSGLGDKMDDSEEDRVMTSSL